MSAKWKNSSQTTAGPYSLPCLSMCYNCYHFSSKFCQIKNSLFSEIQAWEDSGDLLHYWSLSIVRTSVHKREVSFKITIWRINIYSDLLSAPCVSLEWLSGSFLQLQKSIDHVGTCHGHLMFNNLSILPSTDTFLVLLWCFPEGSCNQLQVHGLYL